MVCFFLLSTLEKKIELSSVVVMLANKSKKDFWNGMDEQDWIKKVNLI